MIYLPAIIMVLAACGALALHQSVPFLALNICSQVILFIWYWFTFKSKLEEHFEQIENERIAIDLIYERAKEQNLIEELALPSMVDDQNDDGFRSSPQTYRPAFTKQIDSPEEFKKLNTPSATETEEQTKIAQPFVAKLRMAYSDARRTRWTGPASIGTSMTLREDMYAVTYLYKLKRKYIFGDDQEEVTRTRFFASSESIEREKDKSNFYKDFRYFKKMMTGKWRFMILCQLLLIWFLGYEAITSAETVEAFKTPASNGSIVLARFLCAIVLHITLADEI